MTPITGGAAGARETKIMCVCIYVCIYTYIDIYIHIYIYTYTGGAAGARETKIMTTKGDLQDLAGRLDELEGLIRKRL